MIRHAWIVGMPTTPKQQDLLHVNDEVEAVSSAFENGFIVAAEPTKPIVLRHMQWADLARFACLALSVAHDPSQSRLLLKRLGN